MSFRTRLLPAFLLLLVMPLATGCGDSGGGGIDVPPLTQDEADDMVQLAGIVTGTDQGGWLVIVQSSIGGMPAAPSRIPIGGLSTPSFEHVLNAAYPPPPGNGTLRDTSLTRAGMSYSITYLYSDTAGVDSIDTWNPIVREVGFTDIGQGQIQTATDSAGYFHRGQGAAFGLFEAVTDTLNFDGTASDSLLSRMTQVYGAATRYYVTDVSIDYDLNWKRNNVPAFPLDGTATIGLLAERLNSINPTDLFEKTIDAEVTITFDGTQTPIVGVTNNPSSTSPQFRYKMNLATGVITRFP